MEKTSKPRCGAKRKYDGMPCEAGRLPGKARCKFHGGMSTGPKTLEGKSRISEVQIKRWRAWRIEKMRARMAKQQT